MATRRSTTPDLISLSEAAEIVGVHPRTIRRWVAAGHLTGYRFGPRLIRVDRTELLAWKSMPTAKAAMTDGR